MADKKSSKPKKRRLLRWIGILFLILIFFPAIQVGVTKFHNPLRSPMQTERAIQARLEGKTWHNVPVQWVPLQKIPVELIHYVWASEDQAFFRHHGFDLWQLRQAVEKAREEGHSVRGASTITMQCARSVYLWQGHSWIRKIFEAEYTAWMELLLSKQRILELYLNHIELGPGIYGVGAASRLYFDKSPDQLSHGEMLALAAILPDPLQWSPVHPNAVVQRRIRRIERLAARAPFPRGKLEQK